MFQRYHTQLLDFILLSILILGITSFRLSGQVDTVFWFAAPDFSDGHGAEPIYMRFTTLAQPAHVVISQAANPAFPPIEIDIPPTTSYTLDITPFKDQIENTIPDQVLDRGLLIQSDAFLNVYYENASFFNPEIFTLKGDNSLGFEFVIPMQDVFPNGNYRPTPYASFSIVATEDNTRVEIIPRHNIVGHPAGVPFYVTLNRGQTYVARANQTTAGRHLHGSIVTSDKPIAVTISDDSMSSSSIYGGCADLGGDQITPISILGTRYITVPGNLRNPNDGVFVMGVYDNTTVQVNGSNIGTVDRGQMVRSFSNGSPMIIETSHPAYVLHMSGFGCEVGLDQMPPLDPCNGSKVLSINRSSNQELFMNILVYRGLLDAFTFNGRMDIIKTSDFQVVAGTNGDWYWAKIQVPLSVLNVGEAALIQNTKGPFQLSIIHGGPGSGTMYGYFSDYGSLDLLPEQENSCSEGTILRLDTSYQSYLWSTGDTTAALAVSQSGLYAVTVTNAFGCVAADSIEVLVLPPAVHEIRTAICNGDSLWVAGESFHANRDTGTIILPGGSQSGCDSIINVQLAFLPESRTQVIGDICPGDELEIAGQIFNEARSSGQIILSGASVFGCDSIIDVQLNLLAETTGKLDIELCPGEEFQYAGQVFNEQNRSGTIRLSKANRYLCDSFVEIRLSYFERPFSSIQYELCGGDTVWIGGMPFSDAVPMDSVLIPGGGQHGCDSIIFFSITQYQAAIGTLELEACVGDTIKFQRHLFFKGKERDTIMLEEQSRFGCDSSVDVRLRFFPKVMAAVKDTLCPGEKLTVGRQVFSKLNPAGNVVLPGASMYGCDSTVEVSLFYPENDLGLPNVYEVDFGKEVRLRPNYLNRFLEWTWFPPKGLSCDDCESPWATGINGQTYQLIGIDEFGCVYEAETRLVVRKDKKVFIPNAITPNGDGINDGFTVFGNYFAEEIEFIEIFDRWGDLIIRIDNIPLNQDYYGWDGTHDGQPVNPGVFAYRVGVRFLDQSREVYYGDVTVLR